MSNTIELLETIGSDATLRHAAGEDLARTLAGMHASEGLRQAAASGDSAPLVRELGYRNVKVTEHPTQTPTQTSYEEPDTPGESEKQELPSEGGRDTPPA